MTQEPPHDSRQELDSALVARVRARVAIVVGLRVLKYHAQRLMRLSDRIQGSYHPDTLDAAVEIIAIDERISEAMRELRMEDPDGTIRQRRSEGDSG